MLKQQEADCLLLDILTESFSPTEAKSVESVLENLRGVKSCVFDIDEKQCELKYEPDIVGVRDIVREIQSLGVSVRVGKPKLQRSREEDLDAQKALLKKWYLSHDASVPFSHIHSFLVFGFVMFLMIIRHINADAMRLLNADVYPNFSLYSLIMWICSTPIQVPLPSLFSEQGSPRAVWSGASILCCCVQSAFAWFSCTRLIL